MRVNWLLAAIIPLLICNGALAQEKKEKPSDLERGLSIFQSGLKTLQAMRPIGSQEELTIGRAVAKKVFVKYGARVADPKVNRYVTMVGLTVAGKSSPGKPGYRFAIIRNNDSNAFAAPGGFIFITTGLLAQLRSEAELAGVLAHEIAHVSSKHMLKTIQRSRQLSGLAELSATLLNEDPKTLSQTVEAVTDTLFSKGLDREMEYEADEAGTAMAASAGYEPGGLKTFLVKLNRLKGKRRSVFFTTHPPLTKRVSRLNANVLRRFHGGQALEDRFAKFIK